MKYTIVANGDFLPKKIIQEISEGSVIIALDGAGERLMQRGIKPNIISGDFDSVIHQDLFGITRQDDNEQEEHAYTGKFDITVIPRRIDQNHSDLQKAIRYAKLHGATEINIICAFSTSRLDHSINNTRLLRAEASPDCEIRIHGLGQTLTYATNQNITVNGIPQDKCGIFAFPSAAFTSSGLVWNGDFYGDPYPLNFAFTESACNVLESEIANVTVQGEALITLPPMFLSQRQYNDLPEVSRSKTLYDESNYSLVETTVEVFKKARNNRRLFKERLFPEENRTDKPTKENHFNEVHYVTHSKHDILETLSNDTPIVLSMTPEKKSRFQFFSEKNQHYFETEEVSVIRNHLSQR